MMKKLYEPVNSLEAHLIVQLLEQEGISARIDGEFLQGGVGDLPSSNFIRVMVDEEQYEAARVFMDGWDRKKPATAAEPQSRTTSFIVILICLLVGICMGSFGTYAYLKSPVSETGIDYDGDNHLDTTFTFEKNQLSLVESDRNLDRKIDYVTSYDEKGLIDESNVDDDFDGIFETRVSYKNDNVLDWKSDVDRDGVYESIWHYEYGSLQSLDYIDKYTGFPTATLKFKMNKLLSIEYDNDNDQVTDQIIKFDDSGRMSK